MGVIPRRRIKENLREVEVFIEDTRNEYFKVQDIPDTFVQGRSAFKIFGSPLLKTKVPLKIEILDKTGNTVYTQPIKFGHGPKPVYPYRYITVEVHPPPINYPGDAELVILGELEETEVPFNIPQEFIGTYNVKYRRTINLNTDTFKNTQQILFYKKPTVIATEIVKNQKKSSAPANAYISGSLYGKVKADLRGIAFETGSGRNFQQNTDDGGKSDSPGGDDETELNLWKWKSGLYGKNSLLSRKGITEERGSSPPPEMTLFQYSGGNFISKMVGGEITVTDIAIPTASALEISGESAKQDGDAETIYNGFTFPNYTSRVANVVSDWMIKTTKPYSVEFQNPNKGGATSKIYSDLGSPKLTDNLYANFTASYVDWDVPSTSSYRYDSFVDMTIKNMRTFSGDVFRMKVYGASDSSQGDFPVLLETIVESPELLIDTTSPSGFLRSGFFLDQTHIDKYWNTYGGDNVADTTLKPYYTMSLADGMYLSGSYSTYNQSGRVELDSAYNFTVRKDTPYTLSFKAMGKKTYKKDVDGNSSKAAKLYFHLYGTNLVSANDTTLQYSASFGHVLTNEANQTVGLQIKADETKYGYIFKDFERVSHTFIPKFKLDKTINTDTLLQFRIDSGEWIISDVSLRPAKDTGFSPDEFKIRVPIPPNTLRPDNFDFLIEYYDVDGTLAETSTFENNIKISGSALVLEGADNLLTGSMYMGNVQGSGIELAGANSAYMRSVGYEGFISASAGGRGGFMIWSGSVLPNSPDNYSGSGLEIHDGVTGSAESYFKFRTKDIDGTSTFDVKTARFFFGSQAAGNFISGSNGNIEISSSMYHLDPKNNKVAISGSIIATDGTIGGFELTSTQINSTNDNLILKSSGQITASNALITGSSNIGGWKLGNDPNTGNLILSGSGAALDGTGAALYRVGYDPATNKTEGYYIDFTPSDQSSGDKYYVRFGPNFAVRDDGILFASGAKIEGQLTSSEGKIANWSIQPNTIHKLTSAKYSGLSSTGDTRFFAGSDNLTTGTGSAVFNVKADGKVTASAGLIGGWSLTTNNLKSPNGRMTMSAYPSIERITVRKANMNELVRIGEITDTAGADPKYGIKIYDGTGVYDDDTHNNQLVLLGQQGNKIGGWEITNTKLRSIPKDGMGGQYDFDAGEDGLILMSHPTESRIETAGFVSGLKGFRMSSLGNGSAEFENMRIRGTLRTTVFEKESVNVVGGQLMVANSTTIQSLKSGSVVLAGSSSVSATDVTMSVANASGFSRGEILKVKAVDDLGFNVEYLYVTGSKRYSEDPNMAYLTGSLDSASNAPPIDPDGIAGELYVGRGYGGIGPSQISSSISYISGAISIPNAGDAPTLGATDTIYINNTGSLSAQNIIKIDEERMKITKISGSVPVIGAAGLKASASLNVIRDFHDTVPSIHKHGATVTKIDPDMEFLAGLVSTARPYQEGQVLVSTGKYASGTDWNGRFDYQQNVSSVDGNGKYKLVSGSTHLTTTNKKDATSLQIYATDQSGSSHDSLYSLFDKGSYIVLLVDSPHSSDAEWYRYRVTGNPSFTGTGATSVHTFPIALNQDFYVSGSNKNTANEAVEFWFMSNIQDVSSGYIMMNANPNDPYSPYMDFVERTGPDVYDLQLRTRLGDLSGLSSAYLYGDEEPGFGLYTENGFFRGAIHAMTGSIHGILHIATTQGGIETGEKVSMGRNVYGSNDGIIFGTSGYNYWWTTGDFRVGSEAKYLDFNNSAGTFKLKTDDISLSGSSTFRLHGNSTDSKIRLGTSADAITSTTGTGTYLDNSGIFRVGEATSGDNFIYFDGTSVQIKSSDLDINASGVLRISGSSAGAAIRMGSSGGPTGSLDTGNSGVFMDHNGKWAFVQSSDAYVRYDSALEIKTPTLELDTSNIEISSTQASMSLGDGKIVLQGASTSTITVGAANSIKLSDDGTDRFMAVGKDDFSEFDQLTAGIIFGTNNGTTKFEVVGDANNYISFNGASFDIKSDDFDLDATTILLESANSGKVRVGTAGGQRIEMAGSTQELTFKNSDDIMMFQLTGSLSRSYWDPFTSGEDVIFTHEFGGAFSRSGSIFLEGDRHSYGGKILTDNCIILSMDKQVFHNTRHDGSYPFLVTNWGDSTVGTPPAGTAQNCAYFYNYLANTANSSTTMRAVTAYSNNKVAAGDQNEAVRATVEGLGDKNYGIYAYAAGSSNDKDTCAIYAAAPLLYSVGSENSSATSAYSLYAEGQIASEADITAFASSDKRLKTNIINIQNPIDKIKKLNGISFEWKDREVNEKVMNKTNLGVIAQEVQKVLPEIVKERDDGYLAIKYEQLVPVLIEGIKEQQKQIDELKKKLEEL